MSDVQIFAEALARFGGYEVKDGTDAYLPEAEAVLVALRVADRLVVNRDDLAWALSEIEDCYRDQPKPIPYHEYDRLRSVLTEGGPDA